MLKYLAIITFIVLGSWSRAAEVDDLAEKLKKLDPNVFPVDSEKGKALRTMVSDDQKKRLEAAHLKHNETWKKVTKEIWPEYSKTRLNELKKFVNLGALNPDASVIVTKTIEGDGFTIQNILYRSTRDMWVTANLYSPKTIGTKMPGFILSHSHHNPKTEKELQDMGMTWARAGCVVLVPDHLGHGERREHPFNSDKDFDKPFRVGRQDYYFRYNLGLQLDVAGDSYLAWLARDLSRGVDVLFQQKGIDKDRIILLGAVAGGGDPAALAAAVDTRIACVVPFNFGGFQPETGNLKDPEREFHWFGDAYWESSRGMRGGAAKDIAQWFVVASIAPRKVIFAHEFEWPEDKDLAYARIKQVFEWHNAKDNIGIAKGKGSVKGPGGPDNTHCNNIGKYHRTFIYPLLEKWFGIKPPEEYSKPLPSSELRAWPEEVKDRMKPLPLHESLKALKSNFQFDKQIQMVAKDVEWQKGSTINDVKVIPGVLTPAEGITIPMLLLLPKSTGKCPVVVTVAEQGKAGFLKHRNREIAELLIGKVAVMLVDVRGCGESKASNSYRHSSSSTTYSQREWLLGSSMIELRTLDMLYALSAIHGRDELDWNRRAIWGDSFAETNPKDKLLAYPMEVDPFPKFSEPSGPLLAVRAANTFQFRLKAVVTQNGLITREALFDSPFIYTPHELFTTDPTHGRYNLVTLATPSLIVGGVDSLNHSLNEEEIRQRLKDRHPVLKFNITTDTTGTAKWLIEQLKK